MELLAMTGREVVLENVNWWGLFWGSEVGGRGRRLYATEDGADERWGVDCWSFMTKPSSHWLPCMIGGVRRLLAPMSGGDVDSERCGDGESAIGDESLLLEAG